MPIVWKGVEDSKMRNFGDCLSSNRPRRKRHKKGRKRTSCSLLLFSLSPHLLFHISSRFLDIRLPCSTISCYPYTWFQHQLQCLPFRSSISWLSLRSFSPSGSREAGLVYASSGYHHLYDLHHHQPHHHYDLMWFELLRQKGFCQHHHY